MAKLHMNAPWFRMASVLATGILLVLASWMIASRQIRFGYTFAPEMRLTAGPESFTLEALDLTAEPGEIGDERELTRFYVRQDQLFHLLQQPDTVIQPEPAAASQHLPTLFWIQIVVGCGTFLISGWVWSLRPRDGATRLFFLSGAATLCFTFAAAIYTTRELALPAALLRGLVALNTVGASLFGIATIILFLIYPFRFAQSRKIILGTTILFGIWTLAAVLHWIPPAFGVNLITLLEMLGICLALGAQFRVTRKDPKARASLAWLGLSVLFGAGFFIALNAAPLVFGQGAAVEQGYAFLSFLFLYLGLAAGIYRFRLFEVGFWAYRFLFYALGVLMLLALDAALVYVLQLGHFPALSLAFFAVGFFYLPLRDSIGSRLRPRSRLKGHELIDAALQVAFSPSVPKQLERWQGFLQKAFDPLEIKVLPQTVELVLITDHGISMIIPSIGAIPAMQISYQASGRTLFSPDSRKLAEQIVVLLEKAESNRRAYDRGVAEERRRMAQDLHDDVGARLLTAICKSDAGLRPALEAVLADLKEIVSDMNEQALPLAAVLAEVRYEASRRLAVADIELDWSPNFDGDGFEQLVSYHGHKTLRSGFRELISNVIRHAQARKVKVDLGFEGPHMKLRVADDGRGLPPSIHNGEGQGNGLRILRQRVNALGGTLLLEKTDRGSSLLLKIPAETL